MNLERLTTGWSVVRIIRLLFAFFIGAQAIELKEPFLGVFAAFFLYQALANVACCGVACASPARKLASKHDVAETTFEEVKKI